jgi:CDP-diacylglycerol--serine O-phosphatidyltransferase
MPAATQTRRGVYLLPALFTLGNLLCGFFCIIEAARGHFQHAALLIVAAGILDALDGRIARMTGTASAFGVQLDSLADIVSFGLAPSLLAYYWALVPFRRWGWMVAFLFVVCAATRLARFNIQVAAVDKRYFVGLSSPAAAGLVAMLVYAVGAPPARAWAGVVFAVAVTAAALLMVSRLRYRSFKDLNLKDRRSSVVVIVVALLLAVIVAEPSALAALAVVYALSAPLAALFALFSRGRRLRAGLPPEVPDGPPLR